MKTNEQLGNEASNRAWLWGVLLGILLLGLAPAAGAIEYWVSGQVLQVSAESAEDETVPDAGLDGVPRPWVRVRLFDLDTETLLGEVNSDENGQFTVRYDRALGSAPNVECRVVYLVEDPDTSLTEAFVLRPAREGINSFSAVDRFFLSTKVKILADESLAYGSMDEEAGLSGSPGLGAIITRVGKVEIQFIEQETTAVGGLADFSSDPSAPGSLGVPDFRKAPFGGHVDVFGEVGPPSATCASGNQVDYYRVLMRKPGESTWRVFKQPLIKTKTIVSTTLPLTILHQRGPVGPVTESGGVIDGLYWVNRNDLTSSPGTYVVYSFPDLRMAWKTHKRLDPGDATSGPANGLYEIRFEYYQHISGLLDDPTVSLIDLGCFLAPTDLTTIPASPKTAPVGQLFLRVENRAITATFDHIYLKDPGTLLYFTGGTDGPVASAHDFNSVGLCDVMALASKYQVEIHYTVDHPGGYLRNYRLTTSPNDPTKFAPIFVPTDSFQSHTSATDPLWGGPGSDDAMAGGFETCAYIFDLRASYRQQNGHRYRFGAHRRRAYYVSE